MHKLLTICLLLVSFASFGQAKRALSLIDKQKYTNAFELLKNGLVKDTTSASIPFVLAKLYLAQEWPQNQLDSAYYFAVFSLKNYALLNEKRLDKHIKDGFGKTRLLSLKNQIDSLAFEVAKFGGTEMEFQQFIEVHTSASQLDSAIYLRNKQAFTTATSIHTLMSYKGFMDAHPKAADWGVANANYQKILYAENTLSGKLKAYKNFVKIYPASPFYEEAVKHIYTIEIGQNTPRAILNFAKNYPASNAAKKAIGLLYHKHLAYESAVSFADKYPAISISDSLREVIKLQDKTRLPYWSGSFFQIIDLDQKVYIDSLMLVDGQFIDTDFIIAEKAHEDMLIGKNGKVFYSNESFTYKGEQHGYIFLRTKNEFLLVHKNGLLVNTKDGAYLVGPFVAFKHQRKWGLRSITNLPILANSYDSIWAENDLLFLSQKDKIIILNPTFLYPVLDGVKVKLSPTINAYEWLTDSLLWVEKAGNEGLFSASLKVVIPMNTHQIDIVENGWSITDNKGILTPTFSKQPLDSFDENNSWQIASLNDSLIVKHKYHKSFNPLQASLLGSSAIIMHWADSSFVYLSDSIKFYKPKNAVIKPLLNQDNKVYYYELLEGNKKTIMTAFGQKLTLPKFAKLIPLNQSFFQLVTSKSKQLYSSMGHLLLDAIDGSALINDRTLSILKQQKFGVLQPFDTLPNTSKPIFITPSFTHKLIPLNDSLWVASTGSNKGLIHIQGDTLLPFTYDEINPWVNGLLFLKKDLKWNIFDLKTLKYIEFGVVSFHSITRNGTPKITYQKGVGVGVFDSEKGIVLKPTYTSINLAGTSKQPYYRAEKYVEEAGLHIMLYYNMDGKLLFQNSMNEEAFAILFGDLD